MWGAGGFIPNRNSILPACLQCAGKALDMCPLRARIQFPPVQHHAVSSQCSPHPAISAHEMGIRTAEHNSRQKYFTPRRKPSLF